MPPRKLQNIFRDDPDYARTLEGRRSNPAVPVDSQAATPSLSVPTPEPPAAPPAFVEPAPVQASAPAARQPEAPTIPTPSAPAPSAPSKRSKPPKARTERVAVWIRPLLGQEDRIAATGLPQRRVLQAAWRRAAARYTLGTGYVEPSAAERADGPDCYYSTTLRLDADALMALVRAHDRLRVMGHWSLIRGQVEPLFWQALDELLAELEQADPIQQPGAPP